MRRSFAVRLAAAFGVVGILAAALTAVLVNRSFDDRFAGYLEEQRGARQQQLIAGLVDSYARMGGWVEADLQGLASLALMDGGTLRLEDSGEEVVWEATATMGGAEMHRQMMGTGPLGPEARLPVVVEGVRVGTAVVRLPESGLLPQDVSFRSSVNRMLLAGGIVAAAVALLAGAVLARRAVAPARRLTASARAAAEGGRAERIPATSSDEFGEMAHAFNAMADTIEEEDRLRRQFQAEVAHELRTPIAIIRTQIEAIQDGIVEPTSPALASLHEEALRLTRLVEDLETLASADAATFTLDRRWVDLRSELEEAAAAFEGSFDARGVTLTTDLEPVDAYVDPIRIRQVVANLLSNALKFTPPGGAAFLLLRREGSEAVVSVTDTGPGIAPEELPRVFDRFFRGRNALAGGSGIGLAVVRELVRAHGGTIDVSSSDGAGTTFVARVPDATSAPRTGFTAPSHGPASVGAKGGTAP